VDFSTEFVGRPVRAGNGVIVGTATDLLVAIANNKVAAALLACLRA